MRIVSTLVLMASVSVALRGASAQETASSLEALSLRDESIRTPTARFALERAARTAVDKLEQLGCRRVLSDFQDASGRTIQQALDDLEDTPRSLMARITFREGADRRCHDSETLAFTTIGGREVSICSRQFWDVYRRDPAYVEALLIHEMMHTLGLGENPPSSREITARVLKRCR